jgi:hypothetical protein
MFNADKFPMSKVQEWPMFSGTPSNSSSNSISNSSSNTCSCTKSNNTRGASFREKFREQEGSNCSHCYDSSYHMCVFFTSYVVLLFAWKSIGVPLASWSQGCQLCARAGRAGCRAPCPAPHWRARAQGAGWALESKDS